MVGSMSGSACLSSGGPSGSTPWRRWKRAQRRCERVWQPLRPDWYRRRWPTPTKRGCGWPARHTRRYHQSVQQGFADNPAPETHVGKRRLAQTPARKLLNRLAQYAWEVLAFTRDFRVPFDNNLAERDLRMMKVKQKVAGCFGTLQGAHLFATLRSYLSTAGKQGQPLLQALTLALLGTPFIPAVVPG
jgi:hypothetical protein